MIDKTLPLIIEKWQTLVFCIFLKKAYAENLAKIASELSFLEPI